jgi:hypothetical protein
MSRPKVLAIVQKDARHLWPQIAAFWAVMAAAAALDPTYTHRRPLPAEGLLGIALPLACWNLVMAAIYENRLPGDRQYWLTRPYTPGGLVAAKALFVAVFVNLPVLLAHTTVMAALGIPPWQHLPALAWQQVFLTAFAILPPAAAAAVTTGLRQVLLAAVAFVLPLFVGTAAYSFLARHPVFFFSAAWATGFWLKTAVTASILTVGSAAVLFLQYSRRATAWSRALLAAVAVLVLMAGNLVHKEQSFAVQAWLSPGDVRATEIHIELDANPARIPEPLYPRERRIYGLTHVEIPVRLIGPSPDTILLPGLLAQAAIGPEHEVYAEVREQPLGQWWLSLDVPSGYFDAVKGTAVDLDGRIDLTLLRRGISLPAPRIKPVAVPGIGVCRNRRDFDGLFALECYSPAPRVALSLEFPGGGRQGIVSPSTADVPMPTPEEFQTVERFSSPTPFGSLDEIAALHLVTEQPAGHVRAHFRFPGIHLADFGWPRTYPGKR